MCYQFIRIPPCPAKLIAAIITFFSICTGYVFASDTLSGTYLSASGPQIILQLDIGTPAPRALIVEQFISSQNTVTGTSPGAKKINREKGIIKWLFKNPAPGRLILTTNLDRPLMGSIDTVVRFNTPNGGRMNQVHFRP